MAPESTGRPSRDGAINVHEIDPAIARMWDAHRAQPDSFSASDPRQRALARRCKPFERVLTIGIGNGSLEQQLAQRDVLLSSLDPSEDAIKRMRTLLVNAIDARRGVSHELPWRSGCFDAVVMSETLEHVEPALTKATISEIARVLKPGGRLHLTVPMSEALEFNHVHCPHCGTEFHRWGHTQSFSHASLSLLCQMRGLRVIRLRPCAFADFSRRDVLGLLRSCGRGLLGRLGTPLVNPVWDLIAVKP